MTKHELEAALEQRCVDRIEALGGMALKLVIPGVRGFPDRTMLLPARVTLRVGEWANVTHTPRIWFAEFKRLRTGRISAQQHKWRVLLHQMGFGVYVIDTDEQFEEALKKETRR